MVNGKPITYTKSFLEEVGFVTKKCRMIPGLFIYKSRLKNLPLKDATSRFISPKNGVAPRHLFFWILKKYLFQVLAPTSVVWEDHGTEQCARMTILDEHDLYVPFLHFKALFFSEKNLNDYLLIQRRCRVTWDPKNTTKE